MIGMNLNQYHITASIGAGGMGEVFRARDTRLNRDVAVKVLPKDFAADGDRQRRFEQEAKMLAALNHPNILTIHDAGLPSPRASVKPSHSPSLASLRAPSSKHPALLVPNPRRIVDKNIDSGLTNR